MAVRVLQSFPHKIGAGRICTTAWHQAAGVDAAGGSVTVFPGAVYRPLPESVEVRPTLAYGPLRVPYRLLGDGAFALHDRIVAQRLRARPKDADVVHTWPLGARETLRAARELGIPTVLERPNAHTRFAYETVAAECERIGVALPRGHEHEYNARKLAKEEEEYALADRLLCPSEFVAKTFLDEGFPAASLARHSYGYDERVYFPRPRADDDERGLDVLFVGVCAVRKGLHFALEAWLASPASRTGTFRIAGAFVPEYEAKLAPMLAHPSVKALGHSDQVAELMRGSDVLVLPSIEEGFPLACVEAMGCGCVPLVSEACTGAVTDGVQGRVHRVGDIETLSSQLTELDQNRGLLAELRSNCLAAASEHTWSRAGERLLAVYEAASAPR